MELTIEELKEILRMINSMDSITEDWERHLCLSALVDAVMWGKKVKAENLKKDNRLAAKYNSRDK